jgi:hypothetical protein
MLERSLRHGEVMGLVVSTLDHDAGKPGVRSRCKFLCIMRLVWLFLTQMPSDTTRARE